MRIIDARSGRDYIKVGDRIDYGAPVDEEGNPTGPAEWWQLKAVHDRVITADAIVATQDGIKAVPLTVRFFHPSFFLQRVAFFPS